jgi:hypothetical protein
MECALICKVMIGEGIWNESNIITTGRIKDTLSFKKILQTAGHAYILSTVTTWFHQGFNLHSWCFLQHEFSCISHHLPEYLLSRSLLLHHCNEFEEIHHKCLTVIMLYIAIGGRNCCWGLNNRIPQIPMTLDLAKHIPMPFQIKPKTELNQRKVHILLKSGDVAHLYWHIPGFEKIKENEGIWTCNSIFCLVWRNILILSISDPCEATIPPIGGKSFPIDPETLKLGKLDSSGTRCAGSIVGDTKSGWFLCERFLRRKYTVFDPKQHVVSFEHIEEGH